LSEIPQKYQLKLLSQTDNLEIIREFVSKIVTKAGFCETDVNKIELAVDEACANVIKHAYPSNATKQHLQVALEIDYQKISVIVTDHGRGFDVSKIKAIDMSEYLAEMKVGGLGIHLIKTLMDDIEFDIQPGKKNQVKLVKYYVNKNGNISDTVKGNNSST